MKNLRRRLKKAFTLIELVVVIAVIAILSAVSVLSYVSITKNAKQRACETEASQLRTLLISEDISNNNFSIEGNAIKFADNYSWAQLKEFLSQEDTEFANLLKNVELSEGGLKLIYKLDKSSTELFELAEPERQWDAILQSTVNSDKLANIGNQPFGLKLSYYSDIYSRGFVWATAKGTNESKLYIIEGDKGQNSVFPESSLITTGTVKDSTSVTIHKAYVENLTPGKTYSYKVGSESGWEYGVFKTESNNPTSFTGIAISDAQTKYINLLNVWENTIAQAIETAGKGVDAILYGGDQFNRSPDITNDYKLSSLAYIETIDEYLGTTPYMAIGGNHDYDTEYSDVNCIKFSNNQQDGSYYSYNYGKIHFVHLETGKYTVNANEFKIKEGSKQVEWLENDLIKANQDGCKWIIVSMHNGLFSTGDHSNDAMTQEIVEQLAPLFSQYHVDLVLQAHDHTYCKTLPYKWDSVGYTESKNDTEVINFNVEKTVVNGTSYDKNPNGTYYVTTGAAGHRFGETEKDAGIWAEMNDTTGEGIYSKSFTLNKYKTVVGKITQSNSYEPYTYDGATSDQQYNVGDYAAGNVNANMFGILNIKDNTLTYNFYTVRGNEVKLFDTLNIMKTSN